MVSQMLVEFGFLERALKVFTMELLDSNDVFLEVEAFENELLELIMSEIVDNFL